MGLKINYRILIPLILVLSLILTACSKGNFPAVNAFGQLGVKSGKPADPITGINVPEGAGTEQHAPGIETGTGTGTGANPEAEAETESKADPADGLEQLRPTLQEYVVNGSFSGDFTQFQRYGEMWAKLWLDYTYPDREITDVYAQTLSSGVSQGLSDHFVIQPIICRLDFKSSEPVSGAVRLTNGNYELDIMAVAITVFENNSRMILSGFLGPGEFDESDVFPEAYRVVAADPRFAGMLNPYPQFKLPEEFTALDLRQFTGSGNSTEEHILPGGILAALVRAENDELSVSLYDLIQNKPLGQKKLGVSFVQNAKVENGKLMITVRSNGESSGEIVTVDRALNVTREPYTEVKASRVVSPDGTRYVYSDQGSLYLADVQGNKPQLLLEGNASNGMDRNFYYPFDWASDTLIVYGIGGYEWSNGTGVYDLATGQNTLLKQAGAYGSPHAIRDGRLYTLTGDMGAPYDPYVIDLTKAGFPARQVFSDPNFRQKIEYAGAALSTDGSKIALLVSPDPEREKFVLYLCSTADGSVLQRYEFETVFSSAQYLEFVQDDLLAVLTQEYTMSPKYLYLVQLD